MSRCMLPGAESMLAGSGILYKAATAAADRQAWYVRQCQQQQRCHYKSMCVSVCVETEEAIKFCYEYNLPHAQA